jgi:hypothetical protein
MKICIMIQVANPMRPIEYNNLVCSMLQENGEEMFESRSIMSSGTSYDLWFETGLYRPTRNKEGRPNTHRDTTEYLQVFEATIISSDKSTANWRARQSSYGNCSEETTISNSDLTDVGDLGDKGWSEGDEGAGREAEEGGEDYNGHVSVGGEPQSEHYDGAEGVDDDHGVETAEAIGDDAGKDTAEYAGGNISPNVLGYFCINDFCDLPGGIEDGD